MLNKHTKIIGTIAFVFMSISTSLLVWFAYRVTVLEELLQEQKKEVAQMESRNKELGSLVRLVEQTVAEREEFSTYVLQKEQVIEFLTLISEIGIEQGVELETTSLLNLLAVSSASTSMGWIADGRARLSVAPVEI